MNFKNSKHIERLRKLTPDYLKNDKEWMAVAYIVSSDEELWEKCRKQINVARREIDWLKIFNTDFGSGHRAALYWAYAMWAGRSWGGWINDEGNEVETVDTMACMSNMEMRLAKTVYQALAFKMNVIIM